MSALAAIPLVIAGWFGYVPVDHVVSLESRITQLEQTHETPTILGAFNSSGGGTYRLKSSIGISDTTINLSSFKEPVSNTPYTMSYLNSVIGYGTIEPQIPGRSEFVSFSGITQSSDGSAQLTGVSRGLTRTPAGSSCSASTTLAIRHGGQSAFILSDSPCLFAEYAVKRNDEIITGSWTVPAPTAAGNPTTKTYVDTLVNGGTITTDSVVVAGLAGETITQGQIVFYNKYTKQWNKADADLASTSILVMLGVSQGASTVGVNIPGGVLIKGLDSKNTGNTGDNSLLYVSGTAGATTTSPGTFERAIGIRKSTSQLYFDPNFVSATVSVGSGLISDNFIATSTGVTPPAGSITTFSSTTIPSGWLKTDARAVSRSTYQNLYQILGTSYGVGDGSTTFNLPYSVSKSGGYSFDSSSSKTQGANTSISNPHTINGPNWLLIAGFSASNATPAYTSVKYGNAFMIPLPVNLNSGNAWYYLTGTSTPNGPQDITANFGGSYTANMVAISYINVPNIQLDKNLAAANPSATSINIVASSTLPSLVIGMFASADISATVPTFVAGTARKTLVSASTQNLMVGEVNPGVASTTALFPSSNLYGVIASFVPLGYATTTYNIIKY